MKRQRLKVALALALAFLQPAGAFAQAQANMTPLIEVSADIVEITGTFNRSMGVTWPPLQSGISWAEKSIPTGIFTIGDFARQTALQATLNMLESEGKVQTLSNPKVLVQAGSQADFEVGTKIPYPTVGATGSVGVQWENVTTKLDVKPIVDPNEKDGIIAALFITNDAPGQATQLGNASVPQVSTRAIKSTVEVKSGDTIVVGGLKSSSKTVTTTRIPFIGSIPIIGWLFTEKSVATSDDSLYLFITMKIEK